MSRKDMKKLDRRIRKHKRRFAKVHTKRYVALVNATNPLIVPALREALRR